jgi:hypothetical protein
MQIGSQPNPFTTPVDISGTELVDIDNKLSSSIEGSQSKLRITDVEIEGLLTKILTELRIMNMHLSKMSDEEIMSVDIDN